MLSGAATMGQEFSDILIGAWLAVDIINLSLKEMKRAIKID